MHGYNVIHPYDPGAVSGGERKSKQVKRLAPDFSSPMFFFFSFRCFRPWVCENVMLS